MKVLYLKLPSGGFFEHDVALAKIQKVSSERTPPPEPITLDRPITINPNHPYSSLLWMGQCWRKIEQQMHHSQSPPLSKLKRSTNNLPLSIQNEIYYYFRFIYPLNIKFDHFVKGCPEGVFGPAGKPLRRKSTLFYDKIKRRLDHHLLTNPSLQGISARQAPFPHQYFLDLIERSQQQQHTPQTCPTTTTNPTPNRNSIPMNSMIGAMPLPLLRILLEIAIVAPLPVPLGVERSTLFAAATATATTRTTTSSVVFRFACSSLISKSSPNCTKSPNFTVPSSFWSSFVDILLG